MTTATNEAENMTATQKQSVSMIGWVEALRDLEQAEAEAQRAFSEADEAAKRARYYHAYHLPQFEAMRRPDERHNRNAYQEWEAERERMVQADERATALEEAAEQARQTAEDAAAAVSKHKAKRPSLKEQDIADASAQLERLTAERDRVARRLEELESSPPMLVADAKQALQEAQEQHDAAAAAVALGDGSPADAKAAAAAVTKAQQAMEKASAGADAHDATVRGLQRRMEDLQQQVGQADQDRKTLLIEYSRDLRAVALESLRAALQGSPVLDALSELHRAGQMQVEAGELRYTDAPALEVNTVDLYKAGHIAGFEKLTVRAAVDDEEEEGEAA